MTHSGSSYPQNPSQKTLFRFLRVSEVLASVQNGRTMQEAIDAVAAAKHFRLDGTPQPVSARSLYRWVKAYKKQGWSGLVDRSRAVYQDSSVVPIAFLDFAQLEKALDPAVSIPELIRRARLRGILPFDQHLNRTTVYRAMLRRGIPVQRRRGPHQIDSRRFSYAHRMEMVLVDGKHFRAGAKRARRVAFFFLDDCTRMGLEVIVGPSESSLLFLLGLYRMVLRHGFPEILYLDHGAGFIAEVTAAVVAQFPTLLIHGKKRYPEGHGKVEKFNQTAINQVLRGLDGNPDVDTDCHALTLRLTHWVRKQYNHIPHESLDQAPPYDRFETDPKPLRMPADTQDLQRRFMIPLRRKVSKDHVVSVDGVNYEVPRGHAGTRVLLYRRVLQGTFHLHHEEKLIELKPLDPTFNARSPRARAGQCPEPPPDTLLPPSAADLSFQKDHLPIVDPEGGFPEPDPPQTPTQEEKS